MTAPTPHFGFDVLSEGESIDKNGYKPLGADRLTLDNLIYALFTRSFNGDPALGDPTDAPDLELQAGTGALPASTTFYYRTSYIDQYGLETAGSYEASVTTPDPLNPPTAPALSGGTVPGTIVSGTYNYVITQVDANGGETTVSPLATYVVDSGDENSIDITMPDPDPLAVKFRIYRSRPGQTSLYFLGETLGNYIDTGFGEDQSVLAPSSNTTNARNSVIVTTPGDFIPEQAVAWRIYRTDTPGDFGDSALVHEVIEPATVSSPIPTTVYTDLGGDLLTGAPREVSSTAPQGPQLNVETLTGALPLESVPRGVRVLSSFGAGPVTSRVVNITESPSDVTPVRFTAFFATPPTAGAVTVRASDKDGNVVEMPCSASYHRSGDAPGYFRQEFPLLLNAQFDAELGTRSDLTVAIDPDVAAYSSQAVTLDAINQWVQVSLGELDSGDYQTLVRARVLDFDTNSPASNDLVISILRADTLEVVATQAYGLQSTAPDDPISAPDDFIYQVLNGPSFTAVGGVPLVMRVTKAQNNTQSYDVDFMKYIASVTTLSAGPLTIELDSSGSNGADVNVALWF